MAESRQWTERAVDWFCTKVWSNVDPQPQWLSVQFDITNACNLRCDHCYLPHHKNVGALTYDQWLKVLEQYAQLLRRLRMQPNITVCGGEPLLAPFVVPFLQTIRNRFPTAEVSIQSNGTIITNEIAAVLRALAVTVQISVDGPDAARHESIRGQGSFAQTMTGCALLHQHTVPFYFQSVLSNRSAHWIEELFQLAQQRRARAMHFVRLVTEGHAKQLEANSRDHSLVGCALKNAYTTILATSRRLGIPTNTTGPLWHLIEQDLGSPDNTGFASFVVDYRGGFKVTSRTSVVLGNVLETGMEQLFLRHPLMQRLRANTIEGCSQCAYFNNCRGDRNASFAAHGHFFGPDTGCWVWPMVATMNNHRRISHGRGRYGDMVQTDAAACIGTSAS